MLDRMMATLHTALADLLLPEHPWLGWLFGRMLQFIDVSFIDPGGRFYWVTFVAAMVVLAIAYVLRPDWRARWGGEGFLRFCFPRGFFSHPSTRTDIQLNVVNFFVMPFVNIGWRYNAAYFSAIVLAGMVWLFGPGTPRLEWTTGTIFAFTILIAIANDFGYWVWHYLAHRVPFLWPIHKVHHSAEVMTPLVAGRVHPIENILLPIFRAAATALVLAPMLYFFVGEAPVMTLFGMNLVAAAFALAGDQLFHAHVPISWGRRLNHVFISPATHQIHHSVAPEHWNKNMGAFLAVWDWMFGTLYLPDSRQDLRYGAGERVPQPHTGLPTAYLRPLWEMAGMLRERLIPRRQDTVSQAEPPPSERHP